MIVSSDDVITAMDNYRKATWQDNTKFWDFIQCKGIDALYKGDCTWDFPKHAYHRLQLCLSPHYRTLLKAMEVRHG